MNSRRYIFQIYKVYDSCYLLFILYNTERCNSLFHMSILKPSEYKSSNPRIDGIRILESIRPDLKFEFAKSEETRVITDEEFRVYEKTGKLATSFLETLKNNVKSLLSNSKTGLLAFRRAYVVPGIENPPGPRFLDIKEFKDALKALEGIYDFAIEQEYHLKPKSKIEAFFYPFTDPPMLKFPIKDNVIFPRGGYAVPKDIHGNIITVLAVYGNHEGVQSLEGYDEYTVDIKRMIIIDKIIPQKFYAICTTETSQDQKIRVPIHHQFEQVLSDFEILEAALVCNKCTKYADFPKRIEFSSDGESLFFNEVIDYELEEENDIDINIRGRILVVDGPEDISKITKKKSQILYISNNIVKTRDYGTLNSVASIRENLNILYPGTSATAHAMRVLTDSGHRAFVVGTKKFKDGQYVRITSEKSKIRIFTGIKEDENIIRLDSASLESVEQVGGKAFRLGQLIEVGYNVPQGFVIKSNKMNKKKFFKSDEFQSMLDELDSAKKYAVRSSANVEDNENNAFAGQFDSYLNVKKDKLKEKIIEVWKSAKTSHVKQISKSLDIKTIRMAVVIQEMIKPKYSGVIFGGNIETKTRDQVVIEATKGYASEVVDGTGEVRKIIIDKFLQKIILDEGKKEKINLSEVEIRALFAMYTKLEDNFDSLQDVEWTINKDRDIYLLQSRDLIL
ncbi:hypothetical protein GF362_00735 [Candidatus Dojkabacteria bacterium]|nr:hypothetical protein [Candidatus Dojkabacteria bacterium]